MQIHDIDYYAEFFPGAESSQQRWEQDREAAGDVAYLIDCVRAGQLLHCEGQSQPSHEIEH